MKSAFLVVGLASVCVAQAAIRHIPEKKLWVIDTNRTTYAFGINDKGALQHVYWGRKVRAEDLGPARAANERSSFDSSETRTPEEYPAWGGIRYYEPALKVTFPDGNRDVVLKYVSHSIKATP